jgi:transposase
MVAADARTAVRFALLPGQTGDGPMGRKLLASLGAPNRPLHLLKHRAYAGNETIQLALDFGCIPVVPPPKIRVDPWEYDREMYKRRNEVERLFRTLRGYRGIFSRIEKLDLMLLGFITLPSSPMDSVCVNRT